MGHITLMTDDLTTAELHTVLAIVEAVHTRRHPDPCRLHAPANGAAPAGRSLPPEPEEEEPPRRPPPAGGPKTGKALFGWIKDRSDSDTVLKRAQGIAKRLGYSWRLASLADDQAQEVYAELVHKGLSAPPARGARP